MERNSGHPVLTELPRFMQFAAIFKVNSDRDRNGGPFIINHFFTKSKWLVNKRNAFISSATFPRGGERINIHTEIAPGTCAVHITWVAV